MKDYLPFFYNWEARFDSFSVEFITEKRKYPGENQEATVEILCLFGLKNGKKQEIAVIDPSMHDLWSGVLLGILKQMQPFLNNNKKYRWNEIKKPVLDYWHRKQQTEVNKQKKEKAKTIWTPGGDHTLWLVERFITYALSMKFAFLKDDSLFGYLEKKVKNNFDNEFTSRILLPIKNKQKIEAIASSEKNNVEKIKEIITLLCDNSIASRGPYEDITDPEFKDPAPLLSSKEQLELNALWEVYEEDKKKIAQLDKLSPAEKKLKSVEFWESPQGKRLNELNSRRSYGGTLTFEEKETKKRERALVICEELRGILYSYGFDHDAVVKGLEFYLFLFESKSKQRWDQEREFKEVLNKGRYELEYIKETLQGNWDSDSLTLFGVIIGIAFSIGFGIAALVPYYKTFIGISSALLSAGIFLFLLKSNYIRKRIVKIMKYVLKY